MPELLTFETEHWALFVWADGIDSRRNKLEQTLKLRGKSLPESKIRLYPLLPLLRASVEDQPSVCHEDGELALPTPLFFENTLFEFEFVFKAGVSDTPAPKVGHDLAAVNNAFHFSSRRGEGSLRGSIDMGNQVGYFQLPLHYRWQQQDIRLELTFEVWPSKIDMHEDLNRIYRAIDSRYPLWRFALAQKTRQSFERSNVGKGAFPLLWLAQFQALRDSLENALRVILNAPHTRLLGGEQRMSADRIRGPVSHRLAETIRKDTLNGRLDRRYLVNKKRLGTDTEENRFIKMVLDVCIDKIGRFAGAAKRYDQSRRGGLRLSSAFFERMNEWIKPLEQFRAHPLFKSVGPYTPLSRESLVLQQKSGYAQVYRVWQLLSRYLEMLGNDADIALKPMSELYEVWCLMYIKTLLEALGFKPVEQQQNRLTQRGLELGTPDGLQGAFTFVRADGVRIALSHRPTFNEHTKPVRTWLTEQRPDILLKAYFPDGEVLYWLFDAKYQVDATPEGDIDRVPSDAINQMHRYASAMIRLHESDNLSRKSRPVIGAFALYPGFFAAQTDDNVRHNPYFESIEQSGIGAFPLVPVGDEPGEDQNQWFRHYMSETFGPSRGHIDDHLLAGAARIAPSVMSVRRYDDLCLVATSAEDARVEGYYRQFEDGTARWFHMKLAATERLEIEQNIMREVSWCTIAAAEPGSGERRARWLWPVKSVALVRRSSMNLMQSGKTAQSEELYWLFELDTPVALIRTLAGFADGHHHMKLTNKSTLDGIEHFDAVESLYQGVIGLNGGGNR